MNKVLIFWDFIILPYFLTQQILKLAKSLIQLNDDEKKQTLTKQFEVMSVSILW